MPIHPLEMSPRGAVRRLGSVWCLKEKMVKPFCNDLETKRWQNGGCAGISWKSKAVWVRAGFGQAAEG